MPLPWHDVYQKLSTFWEVQGRIGPAPPRPLILSGWWASNDFAKFEVWQSTIVWARDHGVSDLLPPFPTDGAAIPAQFESDYAGVVETPEWRFVEALDTKPLGRLYRLGYPTHPPKRKPTMAEVRLALSKLREQWRDTVGRQLADATFPKAFKGRKRRRLVLLANPNADPNRCNWIGAVFDGRAAKIRNAVNASGLEIEIDIVSFSVSHWSEYRIS